MPIICRHLRIGGTLLLVALLLAFPLISHAEVSFSVSPIRVEIASEAGGTHTDAIEVTNEGNEKVRIKVAIQDWYLTEEGTPVFQKAGSQKRTLSGWLKINPVDFQLQPGEKKTVRYSVTAPAVTPPGSYWGGFIFETVPQVEPGKKAKAVAIRGNIASIVYFTVGKPATAGDIIDMAFQPGKDGGKILTRIKNSSAAVFRVKGDVKITDKSGRTVQALSFPDSPVLVETTRTFALDLKEKLPAGAYTAVATIDIGAKALLVGEISFTVQ